MKIHLLAVAILTLVTTSGIADQLRVSFVCPDGAPDSSPMILKNKDHAETLSIENKSILSARDIQNAFVFKSIDHNDPTWIEYCVSLTLFPKSADRFDNSIKGKQGGRLGIIINDALVSAPTLQTDHVKGRMIISGNFSEEEAQKIASGLTSKKTEQGAAANP
jgi:preprotein translocase subunit SecD